MKYSTHEQTGGLGMGFAGCIVIVAVVIVAMILYCARKTKAALGLKTWLNVKLAPVVLWRARLRLEMRQAMFRHDWINETQLMRGYELRANPNCRKCYGRGYTGVHKDDGKSVVCSCAMAVWVGRKAKKL